MKATLQHQNILKKTLRCLSDGNFEKLEDLGYLESGEAIEFKSVVREYPGNISMPTIEALDAASWFSYNEDVPEDGYTIFKLWFDGRESDLAIQIDFFQNKTGGIQGRLYDIWVP